MMADVAVSPTIHPVTFSDLRHVLSKGVSDFLSAPVFGLAFGGVFAVGGLLLTAFVFTLGQAWMAYPLVIGFALIGPFIAAGLYEVSRQLENGGQPSWTALENAIWSQREREFGWMAFVVLFVFWVWVYQIRTLVAVFFGSSGFANFWDFVQLVFTTQNGLTFLAVGHVVGAIISLVLFSLTVVACPLLLDRDTDFVTAMVTSVRSVLASPVVMPLWGGFIVVAVLLAAAPAFVGLLFVLPILGHATWHLYRRAISW